MKTLLSHVLRKLATRLDGHIPETRGSRLHLVRKMNEYIARCEGYIIALEQVLVNQCVRLNPTGDSPVSRTECEEALNHLRRKHGRFDTKPMQDAGVWKQEELTVLQHRVTRAEERIVALQREALQDAANFVAMRKKSEIGKDALLAILAAERCPDPAEGGCMAPYCTYEKARNAIEKMDRVKPDQPTGNPGSQTA